MKKNQTVLFSGLIFLGLAGIALSQDSSVTTATKRPHEQKTVKDVSSSSSTARPGDYPVIGYLEKQDRTVTIKSGPKGTLYSVKTADGKTLLENVTLEQVRAQAPELHDFLKAAVAGSTTAKVNASVRIRSDASLR
jgi:hypothetical protein